jgi:hypothetical protein
MLLSNGTAGSPAWSLARTSVVTVVLAAVWAVSSTASGVTDVTVAWIVAEAVFPSVSVTW